MKRTSDAKRPNEQNNRGSRREINDSQATTTHGQKHQHIRTRSREAPIPTIFGFALETDHQCRPMSEHLPRYQPREETGYGTPYPVQPPPPAPQRYARPATTPPPASAPPPVDAAPRQRPVSTEDAGVNTRRVERHDSKTQTPTIKCKTTTTQTEAVRDTNTPLP